MRGKRWIFAAALMLLVLALAGAWWGLRGSLPQLDGHLDLQGLEATVSVQRDANGTVTIEAQGIEDAYRALGFVHAQERYFEMDLMRRSGAGELAALFGPRALETDRNRRQHRLRARARAHFDQVLGDLSAEANAYVAGVNAGLAALRTRPWPYLLLRQEPAPWLLEDSAMTAFAMYFDLQGSQDKEGLLRWRLRPHLPQALRALLEHGGTRWDAPLLGEVRGDAPLPSPDELDLRDWPASSPAAPAAEPEPNRGSNNFAVAGILTRDGRAIVADDMHLGLRAPNIWFRARLLYRDPAAPGGQVEVQGFSLPGVPGIVVGGNGHVAWGFTNSYIDTMDWKLETPCGAEPTPGCATVQQHEEHIEVAGGEPVRVTVEETAWGPILYKEPDSRVLSLRWVAHLPGAANLGLTRFARAASLDDLLQLADRVAMPAQNLLAADAEGQIAWRLLGPIPLRDAACTRADAVDDTPDSACPAWPIATNASPLLRSPLHDRLWTANARVVDGELLEALGDGGYAPGARAAQIRDRLYATERFSEAGLLAIQLDDEARFLAPWHGLLQERAGTAGTPAMKELAQAAHAWEGHASPESVAYRLVRAWRLAVHERMKEGLLAPARTALGEAFEMPQWSQFEGVAWPLASQRPQHLLPAQYAQWDELFEAAAAEVIEQLARHGPLAERTWGERNTAAICHPLAGALGPVGKRFLCMPPQALAGDSHMPRVTAPDFGASQRMVVAPGHEADGYIQMPGGQSGHPLSPFWGSGHDDWVEGRPAPFLPGPAQHQLELHPD